MSASEGPLLPHGGYERLRSDKVAEAVYDATVVFCDRFVEKRSRTHDQMVQAARSGVRNISEGSGAAATSRKSEIQLTHVARSSLSDELARDYKRFLIQRGLRVWHKDSPEALAVRRILPQDGAPEPAPSPDVAPRLTGLSSLSDFAARGDPEEQVANVMLCAVHQAAYLLRRQIESQSRDFVQHGGFTARLFSTRTAYRKKIEADESDASDSSDKSAVPVCPLCGSAMRRRIAQKGPRAGQPFWGCSKSPDCRGRRPA